MPSARGLLLAVAAAALAAPEDIAGTPKLWISQGGSGDADLLGAQALVVKDEELPASGCQPPEGDRRYADKRYLMCAGSILTHRFVLTSASCIHEATYIRHNIRAPLAVLVAPFAKSAQVIKVMKYTVHPSHPTQVDPRDENHAVHDVAIIKLACRIDKINLIKIEFPTEPFVEQCLDGDCKMGSIQKTSEKSYIMIQINVTNIDGARRKRELISLNYGVNQFDQTAKALSFDSNKTTNPFLMRNKHYIETEVPRKMKWQNNDYSIIYKNQSQYDLLLSSTDDNHVQSKSKISIRSTYGFNGCALTGTPVMLEKIQTALVASACDDRQPEGSWQYTDLLDNIDWIGEQINNKNIKKTDKQSSKEDCPGNCLLNFMLNNYCKQKGLNNCVNGSPSQLSNASLSSGNEISCLNSTRKNTNSPISQGAFVEAYYNLYKQKNQQPERNMQNLNADFNIQKRLMNYTQLNNSNQKLNTNSSPPSSDLDSEIDLLRNLGNKNREAKATIQTDPKYLDSNSDDEKIKIKLLQFLRNFNDNLKTDLKKNNIPNVEQVFSSNKYNELEIPQEYMNLYKIFLEVRNRQ